MTFSFTPISIDQSTIDISRNKFDALLAKNKLSWGMTQVKDLKALKAFHRHISKTKNASVFSHLKLLSVRWTTQVLQHIKQRKERDRIQDRTDCYCEDFIIACERLIQQLLFVRDHPDCINKETEQAMKSDLILMYKLYACVDYARLSMDEIQFLGLPIFEKMHQFTMNHAKKRAYGYGEYTYVIFTSWKCELGVVCRIDPDGLLTETPTDRVILSQCNDKKLWIACPVFGFVPQAELKPSQKFLLKHLTSDCVDDFQQSIDLYKQCLEEQKNDKEVVEQTSE
jgi:hypothetical protein